MITEPERVLKNSYPEKIIMIGGKWNEIYLQQAEAL